MTIANPLHYNSHLKELRPVNLALSMSSVITQRLRYVWFYSLNDLKNPFKFYQKPCICSLKFLSHISVFLPEDQRTGRQKTKARAGHSHRCSNINHLLLNEGISSSRHFLFLFSRLQFSQLVDFSLPSCSVFIFFL